MQALQVEAASKLIFTKLEDKSIDVKNKCKYYPDMTSHIVLIFDGEAVTS
jgi:hypothetical protein